MSNNLNGRMMNALIDFNFIVNTDIGLIRFIRDQFADERAFNLNTLNKSDREILSLLSCRNNWNPLSIISVEDNLSNIDKLYNSFFRDYKKEIINLSITKNNIYDFVNTMILAGSGNGFHTKIFVEDDYEKHFISKHFKRVIYINKKDKETIQTMDPYYAKDYRFFVEHKFNISGKNIYVYNYPYNIEFFKNQESKLTRTNAVKTINL